MGDPISLHEIAEPRWVEDCKDEVAAIMARYPEGAKSSIMPLLHLAQRERGYIALADQQAIAELLDVSVGYVESVSSFYAMYHRHAVGKYVLTVCGALTCHHLSGGKRLVEHMEKVLGIKDGETTADGLITLEVTPECLAACDLAPVAQCNVEYLASLTPEKVDKLFKAIQDGKGPDEFIEKLPLMNGAKQSEWKGFVAAPARAAEKTDAEAPAAEDAATTSADSADGPKEA